METTETNNRRRGHVARLPKALRDKINTMLDDGVAYADIVAELQNSTASPLPHPVNEDNIRRWFEGGYQDYLRNQAWRERIDAKADRYLEAGLTDATQLVTGGIYAATVQMCELIDQLSQVKASDADTDKSVRTTLALARLSSSILTLQQHREAMEKTKLEEAAKQQRKERAKRSILFQ